MAAQHAAADEFLPIAVALAAMAASTAVALGSATAALMSESVSPHGAPSASALARHATVWATHTRAVHSSRSSSSGARAGGMAGGTREAGRRAVRVVGSPRRKTAIHTTPFWGLLPTPRLGKSTRNGSELF